MGGLDGRARGGAMAEGIGFGGGYLRKHVGLHSGKRKTVWGDVMLRRKEYLQAASARYEWLLAVLKTWDARKDPESTTEIVQLLARFCVSHHTGRFADGASENVALEVGSCLDGVR